MRIDIGPSDDHHRLDQLLTALAAVGATGEPFEIGVGLNEFFVGNQRLTIYRDAWTVDLDGPDAIIHEVIAGMESEAG